MNSFRSIIFFSVLICYGCDSNRIFEEHNDNFPSFRWDQSNPVEFRPEITDTSGTYTVSMGFRHVHGFQFSELNIIVSKRSPSGKAETNKYNIPLVDENKEYLSECALDICDLESVLETKVKFTETGTYRYYISYDLPVDPLPNVMEVGLIIDRE